MGDLYDVIRSMHPTREMIVAAWSHSLEYSIGTSSHGVNVMNAICDKLGFQIDRVFRKVYDKEPSSYVDSLTNELTAEGEEMRPMLKTRRATLAGRDGAQLVDEAVGGDPADIERLATEMRQQRELRAGFRSSALGSKLYGKSPLDAIRNIVPQAKVKLVADAVFPKVPLTTLHYKPKALLLWAVGKKCHKDSVYARTGDGQTGYTLPYRTITSRDGESKERDFAWLVISSGTTKEGKASWRAAGDAVQKSKMCSLFDMHNAGISDAMFMLASSENKRPCPEMPSLPYTSRTSNAFVDQAGNDWNKNSVMIGVRDAHDKTADARAMKDVEPLGCREASTAYDVDTGAPIHKALDAMHEYGRLPALAPYSSTVIERTAPLRWIDGSGLEVNSVVVYEHVMMVLEGILRCSKIPGLKGLQERFVSGGSAPAGLSFEPDVDVTVAATDSDAVAAAKRARAASTRQLPYSIDLMQMAWSAELASKFYTPQRRRMVADFNALLRREKLDGSGPIKDEDMPELSLKYPGFPRTKGDVRELRQVSIPIATTKPPGQKMVDIGEANPLQSLDAELLRYQTEIAIGRVASRRDIEEHRRSLIGSGYAWGVTGDIFNYDTWADHACASMIGRGNTDGAISEHGGFTDTAFNAVLDAELMFDSRLVERRAQNPQNAEHAHKIDLPTGSTYQYLENNPECAPVGSKRRAQGQQAPRLLPQRRTGSQVATTRYARPAGGSAGGSAAASPSLARLGHAMRRTNSLDDR
tara:strand:+ start:756 stop:3017 length:2262 start_codon:yes stop_codon:yes gene_type:complete